MKRLLSIGGAVVAILALCAALAVAHVNRFLHAPVTVPDDGLAFVIEPGTSFSAVSNKLEGGGVINDARLFRLWARWKDQAASVQAGDYLIKAGTTPAELLEQFTSGDVQLYSFTIIEGWNQWELLDALHNNEYIDATLTDEDWPALLEALGADGAHPEGLFLPETYRFPRNTTDRDVLRDDLLVAVGKRHPTRH